MFNIADPAICEWSAAPYLIFSDNIWGDFIYYSHLFPSLSVLLIASFVLWKNPKNIQSRILFFIATTFTIWSLIDLVLWASERSDLIMFFWSILIHFDLLLYVGCFYFIHAFIEKKYPAWWKELVMFTLFVPLFLFAHTRLNLVGFDFTNCWREALEGPLWQSYVYTAELFILGWIVLYAGFHFKKSIDRSQKKQNLLATLGISALLLSFSFGNITGSIETDWELGQYGLFGMPVFVVFLTYLIVRYQRFNTKLIGVEALIAGLCVLVASLMFVQKLENLIFIALATLILTAILGLLLIRSVKREIEQKQQIEKLAENLESANQRLKVLDKMKSEFVSIASHQLRSPLTAIRGYASMLLEGSYGKLTKKSSEAVRRIGDSSKFMARSVEDYLNVSRIEAGNMKYTISDFNIKEITETIVDEMRHAATTRDLTMIFNSDCITECMVHADVGKTRQIIQNVIDNAVKYTKEGTVTVAVADDIAKQMIRITVKDTGVGMDQQSLGEVFNKFVRAKNANEVNVTGTGLGLYVAKRMVEEMGGFIGAESEGEGKGSAFIIELPLAKEK